MPGNPARSERDTSGGTETMHHDHPGQAVAIVIAGVVLLTVGDVIAKIVTEGLSPFLYLLTRSLFAFVPVLIALQVSRTWRRLRTRRPWGQAGRGLAMAMAYTFYLQSLQELPLADATAIIFASPILVALLSRFTLGERVPPARWIAIVIGFAGALTIVQPGTEAFRPAALWGLAGAGALAVSALLARTLGSTEPAPVTAFYTTGAFLLAGVIPVVVMPGHWGAVPGPELLLIAVAGMIAGTAHFLIILAYRKGEASLVAPFEYSSLVAAVILGFAVWGDIPTAAAGFGMGLVAVSGVLLARCR